MHLFDVVVLNDLRLDASLDHGESMSYAMLQDVLGSVTELDNTAGTDIMNTFSVKAFAFCLLVQRACV